MIVGLHVGHGRRLRRARAWCGQRLFRRPDDLVLQRIFDVVMAFPLIIMALAVVASSAPACRT